MSSIWLAVIVTDLLKQISIPSLKLTFKRSFFIFLLIVYLLVVFLLVVYFLVVFLFVIFLLVVFLLVVIAQPNLKNVATRA